MAMSCIYGNGIYDASFFYPIEENAFIYPDFLDDYNVPDFWTLSDICTPDPYDKRAKEIIPNAMSNWRNRK